MDAVVPVFRNTQNSSDDGLRVSKVARNEELSTKTVNSRSVLYLIHEEQGIIIL